MVWRVCRRPPPCVAAALLCLSLTLGKHQPRNEVGGGCWSSLQLGGTGLSLLGTAFIGAALPSSIPWGFHGSSLLCAAEVWHVKYQEKPPQHWVDPWRELKFIREAGKAPFTSLQKSLPCPFRCHTACFPCPHYLCSSRLGSSSLLLAFLAFNSLEE